MKIVSQKIKKSIAINSLQIGGPKSEVVKQTPRDFIFMCDVSYSMAYDLPKMRTQLKNKITTLLNQNDTLTIIWFSGRGQAGILQERVKVSNPVELESLKQVIDKFLQPVGMTSFLDPLELTTSLLKTKPEGINSSIIFLTDGYNNSSPWGDVITVLEGLQNSVESATFIEYGYYANSQALTEMAEVVGGQRVFAEDFLSYELEFENLLSKSVSKRREVDISSVVETKPLYGSVFSFEVNLEEGTSSFTLYSSKKDTILVSEDVEEIFFFTRNKVGEEVEFSEETLLTSVLVLSDKLKYQRAEELLMSLGDKYLIDTLSVSYGKQKLYDFKSKVKLLISNPQYRYQDGKLENYSPDPKRYCLMNLIEDLAVEGENQLLTLHPEFNYNRIGVKKVTKTELGVEQLDELKKASTKAQVDKVMSEVFEPVFTPSVDEYYGNSFSTLVWNEDRANLSIQTSIPGTVDVGENQYGLKDVPSHIYRTYTFVKDGILNVNRFPVKLTLATFEELKTKEGVQVTEIDTNISGEKIYLIDITELPIINKSMTVNISGKKLGKLQLDLLRNQIQTKYYKYLNNIFNPRRNEVSEAKYSREVADWLKSMGVDDYNGFSPKRESVVGSDTYMSNILKVSVKGFSSIPKIEEALELIKLEKQEPLKKEPKPALRALMNVIKSVDIYPEDKLTREEEENLKQVGRGIEFEKRSIMSEIAQIKFGLILSRNWFTEFDSMDDCLLTLKDKDLGEVELKFQSLEKEEKI